LFALLFSLLDFWLLLLFWSLSFFFELFQSVHGDFSSGGNAGGEFESSTGKSDFTTFAFPNTA